MSRPPRHPLHGGESPPAVAGGRDIEASEVDLIHALEDRRDRSGPDERRMSLEIGGDDTLGRFFDVLDKSEWQSTPTKQKSPLDRTISEPQIAASFDSEESPTGRGRRRRPSLQEFHSLSQKELDTSRKLARRALLKRGAGHRRVASLLASIDETALEGVVPEDGQLQYSDRTPSGGTNRPDSIRSNFDMGNSTQDSNNKQPLDWGENSWSTDMDNFLTNAMRLDNLFLGSTEFQEYTQGFHPFCGRRRSGSAPGQTVSLQTWT